MTELPTEAIDIHFALEINEQPKKEIVDGHVKFNAACQMMST
jgi:hypothetical protein